MQGSMMHFYHDTDSVFPKNIAKENNTMMYNSKNTWYF